MIVAGSFNCELGCPGDRQPQCLRCWLQDSDGTYWYTFSTWFPADSYEVEIAVGKSLDENFGEGAPRTVSISRSPSPPRAPRSSPLRPGDHVLTVGNGTGSPVDGLGQL